jgi:hypothetical protein
MFGSVGAGVHPISHLRVRCNCSDCACTSDRAPTDLTDTTAVEKWMLQSNNRYTIRPMLVFQAEWP